MKTSSSQTEMNVPTQATDPRASVGLRMAGVFMLAACLGLAYNATSPLGVRFSKLPSSPAPAPTAAIESDYQNETLGLTLESDGTAPASAAAAPQGPRPVPPIAAALTWPEVKPLLAAGQILLIDARAVEYYQAEHIPGAVSLPANSLATNMTAFTTLYPKSQAIVIYCGSVSCPLSNQLTVALRDKFGYTNLREMPGGFVEYRQIEAQATKGGAK